MSPTLMERARHAYGPLGIITGVSRVSFMYPHEAPSQYQRKMWAVVGRTVIRGMPTQL